MCFLCKLWPPQEDQNPFLHHAKHKNGSRLLDAHDFIWLFLTYQYLKPEALIQTINNCDFKKNCFPLEVAHRWADTNNQRVLHATQKMGLRLMCQVPLPLPAPRLSQDCPPPASVSFPPSPTPSVSTLAMLRGPGLLWRLHTAFANGAHPCTSMIFHSGNTNFMAHLQPSQAGTRDAPAQCNLWIAFAVYFCTKRSLFFFGHELISVCLSHCHSVTVTQSLHY